MADLGKWLLCAQKQSETIYINLGPVQGPLVIYRVHNNGPCAVSLGAGILLDPGTDCDVSGSHIVVTLAGFPLCGVRPTKVDSCSDASGTYELLCCEAPPQVGTPAAASPPSPPAAGNTPL